jgi:hypothetical protein
MLGNVWHTSIPLPPHCQPTARNGGSLTRMSANTLSNPEVTLTYVFKRALQPATLALSASVGGPWAVANAATAACYKQRKKKAELTGLQCVENASHAINDYSKGQKRD